MTTEHKLNRVTTIHAIFAFIVVLMCGSALRAAAPVVCRSPDGALAIEFNLRADGKTASVPQYRVRAGKGDVVGWSRLGVDLAGRERLGGACEVTGVETRAVRDEYEQFPGKRRHVVGRATETTIRLRETTKPNRLWEVVLRAYDDGVAFRYRFPKQDGWKRLLIAGERTRFAFPRGTVAWALPLNGFRTSYEKRYQRLPIEKLPTNWLLGLPLLVRLPGGGWAAVTEADLDEYAGMYLAPTKGGTLSARLSPLPKEPKLAVQAPLPHESPWRVVMVAWQTLPASDPSTEAGSLRHDAGRLIESDIVLNLNKPRAVKDVSWIKPGKTTFPWWNGYVLDGVSFKPGLNTATMKHYIDFCAANGIEYHSLDGLGNTAWYGGPINPYKGADPTTALPAIDLPAVLKYAKAKGVRLRFWMNWKAAAAHMARAFPLYHKWGVQGVMLDFMDRDDQEMNRFLRRAVKLAAENRLTVTLHGVAKPTGLERTYPNLLTHEGVLNLEYDKWDKLGCGPGHQVTVAFTRMLAGPLDFHQGSFRGVSPAAFKPRNNAPLVMGTPSRTLASYVVYQNHLSMVADSPSAYAGHPALPVLVQIPTTWDDTRVVAGSVGEYIAIARRSGTTWHLGAMTDRKPRTLKLPLKFLGPGRYTAELWVDDARAKYGLSRRTATVTAGEALTVRLDVAGGVYVRFRGAK
jgi:alpha-glucosidase